MNELLELNQRLSYLQGEFVNEVIKRTFWGPGAFLEKHEITSARVNTYCTAMFDL